MPRLVAHFAVRTPGFLLVAGLDREEYVYDVRIGEFDVQVQLVPVEGAQAKLEGEDYWSYGVDALRISVSRHEEEAPPPVEINEKGHRDYSAQRPFFSERLPEYKHVAVLAANRIIRFFKYGLGNPLLHELGAGYQDFQNPLWTDEDGNEVGKGTVHFVVQAIPGLTAPKLGAKRLLPTHHRDFVNALQADSETELHEEILSDAQAAIVENNLRRAVLEMAISCEVAVKGAFFGRSSLGAIVCSYLEDKGRLSVRVLDLISSVARNCAGVSFKDSHPSDFTRIDHLFRCRNKVAHRGDLVFRDDSGNTIVVDKETAVQWWDSVCELLGWVTTSIGQ
jgi:hypothetical protein